MNIEAFFKDNKSAALAFSGGCDSAYLLYAAKTSGADIHAYYVKSPFQPLFELEAARRLAAELDAPLSVIEKDILCCEKITANPADRCYFCKMEIFSAIKQRAYEDGYTLLLDGMNASDDEGDRPGTAAARELEVRSPLRECGLTKDMIRQLSHEAGLFTWNKPAYACLATRIPSGEEITAEKLTAIEAAENYLFSLGLSDLRVRTSGRKAKLQLRENDLPLLMMHREDILHKLHEYYTEIVLDLEVRP